jgi:hypothetical protein
LNKTVLTLGLIIGLAGIAPAQMNITGYLTSEAMPVEVDSVYFEYGSTRTWFLTPGWNVEPMEIDSFAFPEFAGWPAIIKVQLFAAGMPIYDSLYRPVPDSWYALRPPNEQIRFKFRGYTGIQESPRLNAGRAGVVNYGMLVNLLNCPESEVVNYLGQKVSGANLSPGIYFYRTFGSPRYQRLVLIY